MLYELTTGTRLFRGTDVQIMTQVVEEDAPPPSSRVPGYPSDLEEIVLAALQAGGLIFMLGRRARL